MNDKYEDSNIIRWLNYIKDDDNSGIMEKFLNKKEDYLIKTSICTDKVDDIEKVIGNTNLRKYDNINDVLSLANALYIRDTYSKYVKEMSRQDEFERNKKLDERELKNMRKAAATKLIKKRIEEAERRRKIAHRVFEEDRPVTNDDLEDALDGNNAAQEKIINYKLTRKWYYISISFAFNPHI